MNVERGGGLAPGTIVGTHRLERLLGRGGMGVVFLAYDTRLHRHVALKIIDRETDDATSSARLLREARNAAALNHPNICTIHEVGDADSAAFIAMEYVNGRSLRDRLDEGGALPLDEAVRCGIQAADALAYAHEHRVVHRDFKAANVIVDADGRLKIVDFGLARRDDSLLADASTHASLVPAGTVAGTPYAMAPEQVRGEAGDARTDVWALGVLLYELVSGARPFTGGTVPELFSSILAQPAPPLPGRVPVALRAVIERSLEKNPARRYQSAGEVRSALEAIATGSASGIAWRYHVRRRPWLAPAAALVAIGAVLAVLNVGGVRDVLLGTGTGTAPLRLAVLPLEDLSGDATQAYFAAGMHDALITELAKINALRVTARASAVRYQVGQKPIAEIARELDVDLVLTGSVVRSRERVGVSTQLIDGATENHVWTERYDRAARELLALQNEIVAAIVQEVRLQLTPEEEVRLARVRPVDPEAYDAYLRGAYLIEQSTPEDISRGLALLHEAVAKDPSHPLPYAHLAAGYATLGHGPSPPPDAFARARDAALKALELDDSVALAHTVRAELILYAERTWDWPAAERALQQAIKYNPTLSRAHGHYAWYLMLFDRADEAMTAIRRAQEADPLAAVYASWYGWLHWWNGRNDEALALVERALELSPNLFNGLWGLGVVHSSQGRHDDAIAVLEQALPRNPRLAGPLGAAYAAAGRRVEALKLAEDLKKDPKNALFLALLYAELGERESTLEWLDATNKVRDSNLPWIRNWPTFAFLRADPRFTRLLHEMKLPT
ncbi:MAG TPA: protein kinase [Vicinamibacterales bacterium]|nr:protein kinase [Vicinamibacterales bacterium]